MRDRPNIADELIVAALEKAFEISVKVLEFLPMGNDAAASAFRVHSEQRAYFLKLRKGIANQASLMVPHHLRMSGIDSVVAPLAAMSGALFAELGEYSLIFYPWIDGESKWGKTLSPRQWRAWGTIMGAIHRTEVTESLYALVPHEQFGSRWLSRLEKVERAAARVYQPHDYATQMAKLWRLKTAEIEQALQRYLTLGAQLRAGGHANVICHADIHAANIIVDSADAIHIVDWDEVVLAPKERDLMFFLADGHPHEAVSAFQDGYGDCRADKTGLAYYRYDWALQEFCDYGERVLLSSELSNRELQFSLDEFRKLFAPGDVDELAQQAYADICN